MRSVCSSLKSEGSAFGWSRRVCVLRSLALCYVRVHARVAGYEPGFGRTLSRGDVEKAQETFPLSPDTSYSIVSHTSTVFHLSFERKKLGSSSS